MAMPGLYSKRMSLITKSLYLTGFLLKCVLPQVSLTFASHILLTLICSFVRSTCTNHPSVPFLFLIITRTSDLHSFWISTILTNNYQVKIIYHFVNSFFLIRYKKTYCKTTTTELIIHTRNAMSLLTLSIYLWVLAH